MVAALLADIRSRRFSHKSTDSINKNRTKQVLFEPPYEHGVLKLAKMGRGGGNWSELVSGISEGVPKLFCVVLQPAQSGDSLALTLAHKVVAERKAIYAAKGRRKKIDK